MTTASVSAEPAEPRAPRELPFSWTEIGALVLSTAYLLSPWRSLFGDMLTFFLGAFLVFALRLGVDPQRTSPHPWRWVTGCLVVATLVSAGMLAFGFTTNAPGMRLEWFAMGVLLYLPSAAMQEYMLQRYVVGRLAPRLLRGRSEAVTITAAAAFFAICHMPLDGFVLPCFFFSLAVNWIWLRCGKLWPLVLSHAMLGTCYFLVVIGWVPFTGMSTR